MDYMDYTICLRRRGYVNEDEPPGPGSTEGRAL